MHYDEFDNYDTQYGDYNRGLNALPLASTLDIPGIEFTETPTYNKQYYRPFEATADIQDLRQLEELTHGGKFTAMENIAPVAGKMLRPTSSHQGESQIVNGFNTRHFRVRFQIVRMNPFGGKLIQWVFGYSEHTDFIWVNTNEARLSNEMRIFFNHTFMVEEVSERIGGQMHTSYHMKDNAQYLLGHYQPQMMSSQPRAMPTTMTPMDVAHDIHSTNLIGDQDTIHDTRQNFFDGSVKKSTRINNSAPSYMSRTIKAFRNASLENTDMDMDGFTERAVGLLQEPTITGDIFMNLLTRETGIMDGGSITWGELCKLAPQLDKRTKIYPLKEVQKVESQFDYQIRNQGDSEYMHGDTRSIQVVNTIAQQLPTLMSECMLAQCHITATNLTVDRTWVINIPPQTVRTVIPFSHGEGRFVQRFIHRLETELINTILSNGSIDVKLTISCNTDGDLVLWISIAGNPEEQYVMPMWCDHLFTPVMSNNRQNLTQLSASFQSIENALGRDHYSGNNHPNTTLY